MRALAAFLLVALALAGCSDSPAADAPSTDEAGGDASAPGMGNMSAPMEAAPMTHTVMMMNNEFDPANMTIHVGDTVRWHTMDIQRHNVVSSSPGNEFRSSDVSSANVPGVLPDAVEHTFTKAGDVDYVCEYHQGMTGVLHVVQQDA